MTLRAAKAGILSSLQGLGRRGYARFGVNPGGAMDQTALRLVNILLGNAEDEAAVELHFPAGTFDVESGCVAALGGADFGAVVNDKPVELWQAFNLRSGDKLAFPSRILGGRAYLAVAGGFDADEWLGSKSTNLAAGIGGIAGSALKSGDILRPRHGNTATTVGRRIARSLIPRYSRFPTIRVVRGPEFDLLEQTGRDTLENAAFVISPESNRMGFRLSGEPIEVVGRHEMISSPVTFGTIQLLPSGHLIVLMADHQTCGGYPRVANVITHDLPVVAQLSAGEKVAFRFIDISEAESIVSDFERDVAFLRVGCMYAGLNG